MAVLFLGGDFHKHHVSGASSFKRIAGSSTTSHNHRRHVSVLRFAATRNDFCCLRNQMSFSLRPLGIANALSEAATLDEAAEQARSEQLGCLKSLFTTYSLCGPSVYVLGVFCSMRSHLKTLLSGAEAKAQEPGAAAWLRRVSSMRFGARARLLRVPCVHSVIPSPRPPSPSPSLPLSLSLSLSCLSLSLFSLFCSLFSLLSLFFFLYALFSFSFPPSLPLSLSPKGA